MNNNVFLSILAFIFPLFSEFVFAQTPIQGYIEYSYDAAGNRTHRSFVSSSERKAAPDTEENKETAVVSKNNLQASFTPNPTTSGNFAVVVSTSNLSVNEKTSTLEKPTIFIYNPLGELIHQEAAQYDSQVNISLSGKAKGIYIVKVQSREDILIEKVAYQ